MPKQPITRTGLQQFVYKVLPSQSELDAVCLDYFRDIYDGFTPRMDRRTRQNLLLKRVPAETLLKTLRVSEPERCRKHEALLYLPDGAGADDGSDEPVPATEAGNPAEGFEAFILAVTAKDDEFTAFCLDYFGDTVRFFSSGMDRPSKVKILTRRHDAAEILAQLRESYPAQCQSHQGLLPVAWRV